MAVNLGLDEISSALAASPFFLFLSMCELSKEPFITLFV